MEKRLRHVDELLETRASTFDLTETLNSIHQSKCLLKSYSEKLTIQMERLVECLSTYDPDFVGTVLDKSKTGGKDKETIQSSTTHNPGYHMEK